jgi:hypothetical protein
MRLENGEWSPRHSRHQIILKSPIGVSELATVIVGEALAKQINSTLHPVW